jgi:integrase
MLERSLAAPTVDHAVLADGDRLIQSYLLHLTTPRSVQTGKESLLRAARAIGLEHANQIPWAKLDYDAFVGLKRLLSARYPPATANLTLAAVRGVLKAGWMRGELPEELYTKARAEGGVRGSRVTKGRALTESEISRLLETARLFRTPKAELLRALLLVGIGTGLRRAELCSIPLANVHPTSILVLGKGNRERACPLDEGTQAVLTEWLAARPVWWPHRMLFAAPAGGKPLTPRTLWWFFRELAGRSGSVEPFGPHDLRRTFASRLLDGPFGLREVQVFMGHASPDTTARYDKRDVQSLAERRRAFGILPQT